MKFNEEIKHPLVMYQKAIDAMLFHNKKFCLFLKHCLVIGNYLNSHHTIGNALGFTIASIRKLITTKGSNVNALNYLITHLVKNDPSVLDWTLDLKDVSLTSVSIQEISTKFAFFYTDILSAKELLFNITETSSSDKFKSSITPEITVCENTLGQLKNDWEKILSGQKKIIELFAEDDSTFQLDGLFKTISEFAKEFENEYNLYKQNIIKEKNKKIIEDRRKEIEDKKRKLLQKRGKDSTKRR